VLTKPRSKRPSREEAKPRSPPAPPTPLTGGDHHGTPPSPLTPAGPRVAGGAGGDNHGTGGAALAAQLRRAYGEAEAALEEWQLEEFTSSVQTYKECGEEAIQPIIQQLNAAARHHDVEMRDRGLKILQALLEADPSMQAALNDMGATAVMLQARSRPVVITPCSVVHTPLSCSRR